MPRGGNFSVAGPPRAAATAHAHRPDPTHGPSLYRQNLRIKKTKIVSRGGRRPTGAVRPPLLLAASPNLEGGPPGRFFITGRRGALRMGSEGMVKEEEIRGNWSLGKACDACRRSGAVVYCRADCAYLCLPCDANVHGANKLASRHERVLMCQVCEQAPAVVTCKADAAALCVSCDADIHSANPLARRHERLPVLAFQDCSNQEAYAASWLLPNPNASRRITTDNGSTTYKLDIIDMLPEVDPYLDLEYASSVETARPSADSVVPVQNRRAVPELDADASSKAALSHSVSSSSLDVGVVPDATLNDISTPCRVSGFELPTPVPHGGVQYMATDREARVLRYREKRKNRKFEKTIRYASRKAYAETRPRIKGRFAKRTDPDVEQMYEASLLPDSGYGVVPSF